MKAHLKTIVRYLVVALIVVACAYILRPGFRKHAERRDELKRLKADIEQLEAERVGLEARVQKLEEEDPELMESLAREKLHMSKPGETVFKFNKAEKP